MWMHVKAAMKEQRTEPRKLVLIGDSRIKAGFIPPERQDDMINVDVLEKITHNSKGTLIDQYTHRNRAEWCEAILCLDYVTHARREEERRTRAAQRTVRLVQVPEPP